jgi:hypothetical protein
MQVLPLRAEEGLGPILSASLRAARTWHEKLLQSDILIAYMAPDLDIVTYFPRPEPCRASALDVATQGVFERAMHDPEEPIFLSVLRAESTALASRLPDLVPDQSQARILRSVLMRPEHEHYAAPLLDRIEQWVREASIAHG